LINSMLKNISHDPKFQGKKTIAVKIQRKNTAELKPACNRSQQEQSSPLSQQLTPKRSLEPKKSTAQKKTKKRIPQSFQSTLEQQEPHLQAKCATKTPRAKYRQYTQSQLAQALDQIELGQLQSQDQTRPYHPSATTQQHQPTTVVHIPATTNQQQPTTAVHTPATTKQQQPTTAVPPATEAHTKVQS